MLPHRVGRRTVLRGAGVLAVAGLAAACGSDSAETSAPATAGDAASDGDQIARGVAEAAGVGAPLTLSPVVATFEVLTGTDTRVPFGVLDETGAPLLDRDVRAWVVRDGEVLSGPLEPSFYGEGLGTRGVYVASLSLDSTGIADLLVELADGSAAGTAALRVVDPADSAAIAPGEEFPSFATPTVDDEMDLAELCTDEPDCTMHQVSLDEVLGTRPVVLAVATPAYCQTAVCGPVVEVVEGAAGRTGRDDVAYLHAEVYVDAGNTPTPYVTDDLELPSEPWTWVIDADGVVVDRFDGPVVPTLLDEAVARV